MEQIYDSVYYNSNSEADDDDENGDNTFFCAIQVEDITDGTNDDDATIYGEIINNKGTEDESTGVTIAHKGILHVQYCHYSELYYQSCEIYGDDPAKTKEAIDMMAHSSELWSLCDNASSFQVNPMLCLRSEMEYDQLCSEMEYDQQVIGRNQ